MIDPFLIPAAEYVISMGRCDLSMLQRKFQIGIVRAANLLVQLEQHCIVGSYDRDLPGHPVQADQKFVDELKVIFESTP